MSGPSELEVFLQEQYGCGVPVSSGAFTLSRDKALEKLAAFQLPRPTAWVLKIVQAAVASGSETLNINQTSTDTEFYFKPSENWTLDVIEEAFFNPGTISDGRCLDYLKRGLWSVALNEMRPFYLRLPQASEALIWSGREFRRSPTKPGASLRLTVSHRNIYEGSGMIVLRSIQASRLNAEILEELTSNAFTCPIQLRVDGRRLDDLKLCKTHGFTAKSIPIGLEFAQLDAPPLAIPPGSFRGDSPSSQRAAATASAACLVAIHFESVEGNNGLQTPEPQPCLHYWVLDGVVISKKDSGLRPLAVSCAVFASAEGLPTDLTGFNLIGGSEEMERRRRVFRAVVGVLDNAKISLDDLGQAQKWAKLFFGVVSLVGGAALTTVSPFYGLVLAGSGVANLAAANSGIRDLKKKLEQDLNELKGCWRRSAIL